MTTVQCMPRDTLKQYLAGWTDESLTADIERHLTDCPACELTVTELECDPDTLIDSMRRDGALPDPASVDGDSELIGVDSPSPPPPDDSVDNVVREAIDRAGQLFDLNSGGEALADRPPTNAAPATQHPTALGAYDLIRPLGQGGMGAVYLAVHRELGKQVAIKLLPASWNAHDETIARFRREIRAAGRLNHAAIVSATDAGQQQGVQFLVMEYIGGLDLSRIARLVGPLTVADACELARQMALGLEHAHAAGIVHRDVKPSNVMLDEQGRVKLLDFGLAQLTLWDESAAELTSVGQLMGTLDYMAPEQAERGGAVDYRADLYALGGTLFRLLCGRAPLAPAPRMSPLEKLRLLAEHAPPRLDTLCPDAPRELVQLVGHLLARRPEDRPPSAAHVAEQLGPLAHGADLVGLLEQARQAEAQRAELAAEPRSQSNLPAAVVEMSAAGQDANHRGWGGWGRWIAAAAMLGPLVLAAVVIAIETSKGQLVIESEVDDVQVRVLRDGQPLRDLQLETGTTVTRLVADRYEITLTSPSDSIVIDNNDFVLKHGQTVVARVRRPSPGGLATTDGGMPGPGPQPTGLGGEGDVTGTPGAGSMPGPSRPGSELLYDGKDLDYWLGRLNDRSPEALGKALTAIEALVTPDSADRVITTLTEFLPTIDVNTQVRDGDQNILIDSLGFRIVRRAKGGREYFELLARMLDKADEKWALRILANQERTLTGDIVPLVEWIAANVLSEGDATRGRVEMVGLSAYMLRDMLLKSHRFPSSEEATQLKQRVLTILDQSPRLGLQFWLADPPTSTMMPEFRRAVTRRATTAMWDADTSAEHVTEAAIVLHLMLMEPDNVNNVEVPITELIPIVQSRLNRLAEDRQRLLSSVQIRGAYLRHSGPIAGPRVMGRADPTPASEAIELLDLAWAIAQKEPDAEFELTALLAATKPSYEAWAQENAKFSQGRGQPYEPTAGERSGNGSRRRSEASPLSLWNVYMGTSGYPTGYSGPRFSPRQQYQLTFEDFLGALIHDHAKTVFAAEASDGQSPAESSTPPSDPSGVGQERRR